MPQTTIRGYFTPIQPRPLQPAPSSAVQAQTLVLKSTTRDIDCADTVQATTKVDQNGIPARVPSIREIVDPASFSDTSLAVFIPSGHPQAAIVKVLPSYEARLKNITNTLLPVRYPDRFYNECLHDEVVADLSRVLLWNSQPVGWIRCRLEDDEHGNKQIYVQAIGILAPYRGCGLATDLLAQVVQPSVLQKYKPVSIYCHVWESNEDAIEWYQKRGFKRVVLLPQYYRRLRPTGAWIMRRELTEPSVYSRQRGS